MYSTFTQHNHQGSHGSLTIFFFLYDFRGPSHNHFTWQSFVDTVLFIFSLTAFTNGNFLYIFECYDFLTDYGLTTDCSNFNGNEFCNNNSMVYFLFIYVNERQCFLLFE
jgi:hypothetical protein